MKKDSTPAVKAVEILAVSLAIGVINWFFPGNPGFLEGFFNPYAVIAIFIAAYYGKYFGLLSIGFSILVIALGAPAVRSFVSGEGLSLPFAAWERLWALSPIPLAAAIVEVYLMGLIRDSLSKRDRDAKGRLSSFTRDKGLLKRQVRALQSANSELEERISRQEDSITSLYSQVQVLNSLNLAKALQAILEMVRRFIGATRCSIWEHRQEAKSLALVASIGGGEGATGMLPDESSIEGWVVRNNMMFSVKMLLTNEPLAKLDTGRNIMTLPITAGRRIWGVLNIEEMPFVKYNLYSERLLLMIMLVRQEDVHLVTGLPSFSQFYAMLQRELGRLAKEQGTLAVLVLEVANYQALAEEHGKEQAFALLRDISRMAQELSGSQARLFHYKADPQLAVLYPNLDADGASLFSLTLLEKVNAAQWKVRDARVFLELILGFSARAGAEQSADDLLAGAENLLEMQKV